MFTHQTSTNVLTMQMSEMSRKVPLSLVSLSASPRLHSWIRPDVIAIFVSTSAAAKAEAAPRTPQYLLTGLLHRRLIAWW